MRSRWHVRVNALVLAWLVAAGVVTFGHRSVPAAPWLMVHLLLLGAVSTAILIWSAHFAEAVRRRPLPGGLNHQAVRLALHTAGALAVVAGLLAGAWPVLAAGSVVVAVVALWHAGVLVAQGRQALGVRLGWTAWYFVAAAVALPVGAALGAALARVDLAGDLAARTYVGHVAVMMLGWVGLTVVGTMVTLWPTMLRVQLAPDAATGARHGLTVLLGGLVTVLVAVGTGHLGVAGAGLVLYLLGLLRTSWPLLVEARRRLPDTFAARSVGLAWLWLVLAVLLWAVGVLTAGTWDTAQVRMGAQLGPLTVGFGAQVLLGALTHLGPMVLGGGPSAVRAARVVVDRGGTARLLLTNVGLAVYLLPVPSLVRVGMSLLVLGALAAAPVLLVRAAVVSRRLRHLPQTGPAAMPPVELLVRPRRPMGPGLVAAGALALVVAGAVAADPAALGLGAAAAAGAEPTGQVVEVEVEAQDMRFEPSSVEVAPGDRLVLVVTNVDDVVHDLVLDSGVTSGRLAPGATARVDVGVVGRSMAAWCSVAGHRQMGMTFDVEVTGDGALAAGGAGAGEDTARDEAGGDDAGGSGHGSEHTADDVTAGASAADGMDLRGEPGEGVELRDAVLPPADDATVHRLRLEVQEVEREVAPGVTQTLWTFGGTAPGPVLRGRVGDTFEITLVNDGSIGHSIDFHAGALAPDRPMRTIEPGESLTYTFTATRAGIWMYHCSTMPMSLHIANGMFGAVVIDPPDLPPVDREYLLVQSELYLGEPGGIADSAAIAAERPDAVVFNGYANQYDHAPLTARVGERVRIWVLDAGPNRLSSFHVVGGQFDTVYLEGAYQLGGSAGPSTDSGAQVLGLMPAQGGFVELSLPEAGSYPFVSHLMVDAERGAHGLLTVSE